MAVPKRKSPSAAAAAYGEASFQRLRDLIVETADAPDPDLELFAALRRDPAAREVAMAWLLQKFSTTH